MKKNWIANIGKGALAAVLALSLGVLGACGGGSTEPKASESPAEATEKAPEQQDSKELPDEIEVVEDEAEGEEASAEGETFDNVTIKIGASPAPHAEILENIKEELAARGINLDVSIYTDYIQPNVAVFDGSLDGNFFQHMPYLDDYNAENGTDLVSVGLVHFEPMAIFAGKTSDLAELADGAKVAVPNDPTNEARALQLLAAQGLIKIKDGAGLKATKKDIEENSKNLEFFEVEAAQVARSLQDVDIAVINGNYALAAGLNLADGLAAEAADSEAAQTFGNVFVAKAGSETRPEILAVYEALTSDASRAFIEEKYQGAVVPVF